MLPLEKLESFMRLLHKVQHVERVARIPNEKQWRTTAEHTFELALLCWYIASANKLALDQEKILKYALAHDLVEGYAGDTPAYDTEGQKTKKAREAAGLAQLASDFAEFPDLLETIRAYEKREDPEARFVYATDKLIDPLNSSMEKTRSIWKDVGVSYEQLRSYKEEKIAISPEVLPYWHALRGKIEKKKEHFFDL